MAFNFTRSGGGSAAGDNAAQIRTNRKLRHALEEIGYSADCLNIGMSVSIRQTGNGKAERHGIAKPF
jgi:hypothetical protein